MGQFGTLQILADLTQIVLNVESGIPLYRQLAESIRSLIDRGRIQCGERLPATRELASQFGLNRATVSAAYNMLEESGVLEGHVGRGSFVAKNMPQGPATPGLNWDAILPPIEYGTDSAARSAANVRINLASSRPATASFPLAAFRRLTQEVINSNDAETILQLGSPHGYAPLRRYLLAQALDEAVARPSDDLLMTNGCQQALDLIARLFIAHDQPQDERGIALESPVYHGLVRVFTRAGAHMLPVAMDSDGLDPDALATIIERSHPRMIVVTPSFQNPMGVTLSLDRRKRIVELAQQTGTVLIENDIYSELRYRGGALPTLKELDKTGSVILLRSYSKISFPGLRVGWVIGPQPFIARLAEAKQVSDLHSDQLAQAVLLKFAQSGELARHLEHTRHAGLARLQAAMAACERYLPRGSSFTRPDGGMCFWIELPSPLNAENVLSRVEDRGVSYLPGTLFSNRPAHRRGLRISFGGLPPEQITEGIRLIAEAAAEELRLLNTARLEPMAAIV